MNSSTDPRARTRVLREFDHNVTITHPDDLDLSNHLSVGSQSIVSRETVQNAIDSGYREGWNQGFDEARAAVDQAFDAERQTWRNEQERRLTSALTALSIAASEFQRRRAFELTVLEDAVAAAAFDLACALLGRELELTASPGRDAVARALSLAPAAENLALRLNPADMETLGDIEDLLIGRQCTLVPDPSIESGGCLLDAKDCHVDARLSTAVARARQAMIVAREEPTTDD